MMKRFLFCAGAVLVSAVSPLSAQNTSVALPSITVYSQTVAIQEAGAGAATPVTALRFEPGVDLQARNFAEGQADIILRGGIFENTGMRIGAVSLLDPQTGHYLAEIPIAPSMLSAPSVLTGTENALNSFNANVGSLRYSWRPILSGGFTAVAAGTHAFNRQEFHQGYSSALSVGDQHVAADVNFARSESDGAIAFGDHSFQRLNGRVQLAGPTSQ